MTSVQAAILGVIVGGAIIAHGFLTGESRASPQGAAQAPAAAMPTDVEEAVLQRGSPYVLRVGDRDVLVYLTANRSRDGSKMRVDYKLYEIQDGKWTQIVLPNSGAPSLDE